MIKKNEINFDSSKIVSAFTASPEAIKTLQNIHEIIIKNYDICKIIDLLKLILTEKDYIYIIKNLFDWHFEELLILVEIYNKTAINYSFDYKFVQQNIKNTIKKLSTMGCQKNINEMIKVTASCINNNFYTFIDDFTEQEIFISLGLQNNKNITEDIIREMIYSEKYILEIIGAKCYFSLKNPSFNLDHLVNHSNDQVLTQVIKQYKNDFLEKVNETDCVIEDNGINYNKMIRENISNMSNYVKENNLNNIKRKCLFDNELLLSIIFRRGIMDELNADIIKLLNFSKLNQKDLERIYSLFHLNPLNYISYEIYKFGFVLNENIVIDLIKALENVFSDSLFKKISNILSSFKKTEPVYNQMIISLSDKNYNLKYWILRNLNTENIQIPFFIKFCWYLSNEDDLDAVELGIGVLKKGKIYDIIDKWAKLSKFNRITRRVYPLKMENPIFYKKVFDSCKSKEEKIMLKRVYDLKDF